MSSIFSCACYPSVCLLFLRPVLQKVCLLCFLLRASQVALAVKNLPANAGDIKDVSSIPRSGRSPGGGYGNLLQYFCLENPMDKGAWWATVHRVAKSQKWLKWLNTHTHTHTHTHKNFIISGPTLKSLIGFVLIFLYSVREGSNFILLKMDIQFSQHHCMFLTLLSKVSSSWIYFWALHSVPLVYMLSLCQYLTVLVIVGL